MKNIKFFSIILLISVIFFSACKDNAKNKNSLDSTTNASTSTQKVAKVWHYTCSKGCAGGADTAVNCSTCNTLLVHNNAFHAQVNNIQPPVINPPTINQPVQPVQTSAQNAAGIWHYTCLKGCAGGSGTVGACNTCGDPLAHNQAYHQ